MARAPLRALLAGALAALAVPAAAEVVLPLDHPPDPLESRWKAGPLRLDPFVRLEEFGWDSNVFLAEQGKEQGDLRIRVGAGVRGQMFLGRDGSLTFEEHPSYLAFATTSGQNYLANRLSARTDWVMGRVSLASGGNWTTTRDPPSSEFDQRARNTTRSGFAAVSWRPGGRTSFAVSDEQTRFRISDQDQPWAADSLNRTENRLAERLTWRLRPRTALFAEHSAMRFEFDAESGRDSELQYWTVGAVVDAPGPLTGKIQIGPARLSSDERRFSGEDGIFGETTLAWHLGESWLLLGTGGRSLQFAQFENNLFYHQDAASVTLSRALTPRFAVEAGTDWTQLQWPARDEALVRSGDALVPACSLTGLACSELRRDRIVAHFAGVRYRVTPRKELTGRLEVRRRRSNLPDTDQDQVLLTTGATF